MTKSKIYIATSKNANLIAEKLRDELRKADYDADTRDDAFGNYPGQSRFEVLQQLVKKYYFAVIIFAKDDVLTNEARDSCVFEAGFFMAALTSVRCILVSGVGKKDLPAVLEGIILYKFDEPDDLADRIKVGEAIQAVSSSVKDRLYQVEKEISARGPVPGPLSRADLLARERMIYEAGGQLLEDQVVVASMQPREREYNYAARVRENIDRGIRYVYLINGNDDAAYKTPRMLQLLLLANLLKPEQEGDLSVRRDLVKANQNKIVSDMKDICANDKLNIYFLSDPLDMEYCIFNATDRDSARMYVKHRDEYIEWESGDGAHQFWDRFPLLRIKTKEKAGADNQTARLAVFHAVDPFELDKEPFFSKLRRETLYMFPEIGEQVLELCLKGLS